MAVIVGMVLLTIGLAGLCIQFGPNALAFLADVPRFHVWVDKAGVWSRVAVAIANVAQIVVTFLPGEPLELVAGYAFDFLVFLVLGTPKDLLTYVAGLSKSPLWRIVTIATVGRIPSIVSSTALAGALGEGEYLVAVLVAAVPVVLALVSVLAFQQISY